MLGNANNHDIISLSASIALTVFEVVGAADPWRGSGLRMNWRAADQL
jgi:hypothetical protein